MNNIQSQPTFTGTLLRNSKLSMVELEKRLNKHFDIKPIWSKANPYDTLETTQAGFQASRDGYKIVGKDELADKFIYRLLRKVDKDVEYVAEDYPLEARIDKKIKTIDFTA